MEQRFSLATSRPVFRLAAYSSLQKKRRTVCFGFIFDSVRRTYELLGATFWNIFWSGSEIKRNLSPNVASFGVLDGWFSLAAKSESFQIQNKYELLTSPNIPYALSFTWIPNELQIPLLK